MGAIGQNFHVLSSVDSTNNYAMAQVQNGAAKHGDTYFAHEQTAGKGQRNKIWSATAGENLIMSIVLYPEHLLLTSQYGLSMAVALSCYHLLAQYQDQEIKIKWPNDLYWNDRKAGGILIENGIQGSQWQYAIVGIGINVNQTHFPAGLKNPVSLQQMLGYTLDVITLAKTLCGLLETSYQQLKNGQQDALLARYNKALYKNGEAVKLRRGNVVFPATVQGVDQFGRLLAQTSVPECFQVGEVEWVI